MPDEARVLFVTPCAFNKVTGGGVTFSNLFNGWPKNSIATIHNDPDPVIFDVCDCYYFLKKEIKYHPLIEWLLSFKNKEMLIEPKDSNLTSNSHSFAFRIKNLIFGDGVPKKAHLTKELNDWILTYRPTVIYTILGSNAIMELVELIRVRFNLPLVIHIMDDWPSSIYVGGIFSFLQRFKMQSLLFSLMNVATTRLAISAAMASEYETRYKVPFNVVHNAIDFNSVDNFVKQDYKLNFPIKIVYIGSIFPNAQLNSLLDCCEAILDLSKEGLPIEFAIYCPRSAVNRYFSAYLGSNVIKFFDLIDDDSKYFSTLCSSDILVLPVNFDPISVRYIKYSIPTKLPSYLGVAAPILVYGPLNVAQVSYANKMNWGLVVGERDKIKLKCGFLSLINDAALRERFGKISRSIAVSSHDLSVVKIYFQNLLTSSSRIH